MQRGSEQTHSHSSSSLSQVGHGCCVCVCVCLRPVAGVEYDIVCSQDDPLVERQPSQYESEPLDRQSGTVASTSSSSLASEQLEESLSAVSLPEVGGAEASGWQLPVEPGDSLSSSMESQLAAQPPAPAAQSRQEGEEQGEERHVTGQWWCSCVA